MSDVVIHEEVIQLPLDHKLTDKELIAKADELTALYSESMELDLAFEGQKGAYKSASKANEEKRGALLYTLMIKTEKRPTDCYIERDFFEGIARTKRCDNDEVVNTRTLTAEEYQQNLPETQTE